MNCPTTNEKISLKFKVEELLDPQWSPDGHWIAYEIAEDVFDNNIDSNIHLISPDGIDTQQLTRHPGRDRYPAWVPEAFLSVSPTVEKQTTLWGRLKKSIK
ncbi:MAG: hypothetical protein OXG97_01685 [Candidatus Poribacteria bacterium]|nr:hypothetical protein [Candidatus Poribacteria bacterium]